MADTIEQLDTISDTDSEEMSEQERQLNKDLYTACDNGDVAEVETLLSRGGDINYHNEDTYFNYTPLHTSAVHGHEDVVKLLLEQQAVNVDARDVDGWTPLHYCAYKGHPAVAKLLLDAGASLSSVTNLTGSSPLHLAAYSGHLDTVELFVVRGADVSLCNEDGDSPLHDAAYSGHLDSVKFLLQHGANMSLQNKRGRTALDMARRRNKHEVVEYLESVERSGVIPPPHESQSASTTATPTTSTSPQQPTANVAIKALNHWVTMRLSKFRTMGAPGSGKTSVLDLTMGKPPATDRESTDCMEPPTRMVVSEPPHAHEVTIAPILAHEKVWEEVTRDRMNEMVGKALKARIDLLERQDVSPEALSPPRKEAKPDADVRSASDTDDMAHEVIHSTRKEQKPLQVITAMVDQLEKMNGSMELMDVHWVFTQDTGGQPCYQSVAPLLLRENSCSVITTKLNEEFKSKPEFAFFIKGKPIKMSSTKIQLTNLQLIETLVKSQASVNPSLSPSKEPKHIIVGTFWDKAHNCKETIKTKNAILKKRLYGLEDQRFDSGESIIFPINAVNPDIKERRESADWLRRKILKSPGATVKEEVNIRWFGLLLHLITEEKDVYTLDECLEAGKTLRMNEDEIFQALKFFHGLGIIIHFRTKDLEGVVVVKVEVIFGTLSLLLGISFIDRDTLDHEFKLNLTPNTQERLQRYGRFNKELLLQLQFKFSDVFTAKYFLDLLEHVTAIAAVGKDEYFLPSALAFATDEQIKLRVKGEPWIIRLTREEESSEPNDIPPPLAYLPSLVINVLKSSSAKLPSAKLLSTKLLPLKSQFSQQYSNALSLSCSTGGVLHFIQRFDQIEVYFSLCEDQPHKCHNIRSVVLAATETTEDKLNILPGVLIKNDAFLCPCDEGSSDHVYTYNSDMKKALCEKSEKYHELTLSQQRWLDGAQAGDSKLPSRESTSVSVFKQNEPVTLSSPAAQRREGKQAVYDTALPLTPTPVAVCSSSKDLPAAPPAVVPPSASAVPSADPLNKPPTIKELLRRVASRAMDKWRIVGLELEIEQHQLNTITHQDAIQCYIEVFSIWQRKADPPFTWATIIDTLRSPIVRENALAQEIEDWLLTTAAT